MRDWVSQWTHGPDWKTWVAHSAIALIITAVLAGIVGIVSAGQVAVGYYLIRELEQIVYGIVDRKPLAGWRQALDHVMDVAAPACAVLLAVLAVEGVR